jgi:hypothetical protein
MKEENKRTSYIRGRAVVRFGGAIGIEVGHYESGEFVVAFKEAKEQKEVGDEIGIGETWDTQVILVFDNPKSVSMVRDALDCVESGLKYGKLSEPKQ